MNPFTVLPVWALFLTTIACCLLAVEVGFRFGRRRASLEHKETEKSVSTMVGATLGLLAFMLAFTFGSAAARFGVRKQLVIDDANAVQAAFLRAELLQAPHAKEIQNLLEEYVDLRVAARQTEIQAVLSRSEEIQNEIWARAVVLGHENPEQWTVEDFSKSVNRLIDQHNTRKIMSLYRPLPTVIVLALNFLLLLGMCLVGYQLGLASDRRTVASAILVVAFAVVMTLIAELDSVQSSLLRVNQQAMIEVQNEIRQRSAN
jgi:hypothetical protein